MYEIYKSIKKEIYAYRFRAFVATSVYVLMMLTVAASLQKMYYIEGTESINLQFY